MIDRGAAIRYAKALFDVAVQEADLTAVERDLAGFVSLVQTHTDLQQALLGPAVPAAQKRAVISALAAHANGVSEVVMRLLGLLADRGRLSLLPEIDAAFQARVMEHWQLVRAEVTTAVPLPADRRQALEARLAATTGKQVAVEARVDAGIIGGVIAKIGSTVYDGSVTRQLERMRERLGEEA